MKEKFKWHVTKHLFHLGFTVYQYLKILQIKKNSNDNNIHKKVCLNNKIGRTKKSRPHSALV